MAQGVAGYLEISEVITSYAGIEPNPGPKSDPEQSQVNNPKFTNNPNQRVQRQRHASTSSEQAAFQSSQIGLEAANPNDNASTGRNDAPNTSHPTKMVRTSSIVDLVVPQDSDRKTNLQTSNETDVQGQSMASESFTGVENIEASPSTEPITPVLQQQEIAEEPIPSSSSTEIIYSRIDTEQTSVSNRHRGTVTTTLVSGNEEMIQSFVNNLSLKQKTNVILEAHGPVNIGDGNKTYNVSGKEEITGLRKNLEDEANSMIENLKNKVMLYGRNGINSVLKCLETSGFALITGVSGEGKTTAALEVMRRLRDGEVDQIGKKTPLIIKFPQQWDEVVNINNDVVILVDDIFGEVNFNEQRFQGWNIMFPSVKRSLELGHPKLLITSRSHVYQDGSIRMESCKSCLELDSNRIDLSSEFPLTKLERFSLLEMHNELLNDRLSSLSLNRIASVDMNPCLGFPQACFIFFHTNRSKATQEKHVEKCFVNPYLYLVNTIEDFKIKGNRHKYFALVYCLLQTNNRIEQHQLDPFKIPDTDEKQMNKIAQACGIKSGNLIVHLQDALESLSGSFIVYDKQAKSYTFCHQSVWEAVCLVFGKTFPDLVLESCSDRLIIELLSLNDTKQSDVPLLFVPEVHYRLLSKRVCDIIVRHSSRAILCGVTLCSFKPLMHKKFIKVFMNYVHSSNKVFDFVEVHMQHYHEITTCSPLVLTEFFEFKFDDIVKSFCGSIMYTTRLYQVFFLFIRAENMDAITILVRNGVVLLSKHLYYAAFDGSKTLLNFVLENQTWTTTEIQISLEMACLNENIDVVSFYAHRPHRWNYLCLQNACLRQDIGVFTQLLHICVDNGISESELQLLLEYACKKGLSSPIGILAERGVEFTHRALTNLFCFGINEEQNLDILSVIMNLPMEQILLGLQDMHIPCSQRVSVEIFQRLLDLEFGLEFNYLMKWLRVLPSNISIQKIREMKQTLNVDELASIMEELCCRINNFEFQTEIAELYLNRGGTITLAHLLQATRLPNNDLVMFYLKCKKFTQEDLTVVISRAVKERIMKSAELIQILMKAGGSISKKCLEKIVSTGNEVIFDTVVHLNNWQMNDLMYVACRCSRSKRMISPDRSVCFVKLLCYILEKSTSDSKLRQFVLHVAADNQLSELVKLLDCASVPISCVQQCIQNINLGNKVFTLQILKTLLKYHIEVEEESFYDLCMRYPNETQLAVLFELGNWTDYQLVTAIYSVISACTEADIKSLDDKRQSVDGHSILFAVLTDNSEHLKILLQSCFVSEETPSYIQSHIKSICKCALSKYCPTGKRLSVLRKRLLRKSFREILLTVAAVSKSSRAVNLLSSTMEWSREQIMDITQILSTVHLKVDLSFKNEVQMVYICQMLYNTGEYIPELPEVETNYFSRPRWLLMTYRIYSIVRPCNPDYILLFIERLSEYKTCDRSIPVLCLHGIDSIYRDGHTMNAYNLLQLVKIGHADLIRYALSKQSFDVPVLAETFFKTLEFCQYVKATNKVYHNENGGKLQKLFSLMVDFKPIGECLELLYMHLDGSKMDMELQHINIQTILKELNESVYYILRKQGIEHSDLVFAF